MRARAMLCQVVAAMSCRLALACSEDIVRPEPAVDAATPAPRDSGAPAAPPILERPGDSAYTCTRSRAPTRLEIGSWFSGALLDQGETTLLARIQADCSFDMNATLAISSVDTQGALGPASTETQAWTYQFGMTALPLGKSWALLWIESREMYSGRYGPRIAIVDEHGQLTGPSSKVDIPDSQQTYFVAAAIDADRIALLWSGTSSEASNLYFTQIDRRGQQLQAASMLVSLGRDGWLEPVSLVRVDQHYIASFDKVAQGDAKIDQTGAYLAILSADGVMQGEPNWLGKDASSAMLMSHGDDVLIAREVSEGSSEHRDLRTTLRLAHVDAQGQLRQPDVALQSAVASRLNRYPQWIDMGHGDDVGLLWSNASVIYVCAGCMPDDALEFVVLDARDWTPKSTPVDLPNPPSGGLTNAHALLQASDLIIVSNIQHHTSSEAAISGIHCEQ